MSQVHVGNGSGGGGGGGVTGPGSSTNNSIVTWNGTTGTALFSRGTPLVSSTGVMTNTNQPCFAAFLNANLTNATGDGTSVNPIIFNTTTVNQGSNYNTGTGVFTAPVTGCYLFTASIFISNLSSGHTSWFYSFRTSNAINTISPVDVNPFACSDSGSIILAGSAIVFLNATQTMQISTSVTGSTKTVTIDGGAVNSNTYFSGVLLC